MDVPRSDRSLGDLFSDLSQQTAELIRQEVRLAKVELSDKVSDLSRHAMMIGIGAALGLGALMAFAATITLLLIEVGVEPWIAAILCAVILGIAAYALVQSGLSAIKRRSLTPDETIHSMKETTQWLKNQTR
jgi:uncharacterized membrane protein YqjE